MQRQYLPLLLMGIALLRLPDPVVAQEPARPAKAKLDAFGDPLPKFAIARLGNNRWRHSAEVQFVRFCGNDRYLVSWCRGDRVRLADSQTGQVLRHFGDPLCEIMSATHDGAFIAQVNSKGVASVWKSETGQQFASFNIARPSIARAVVLIQPSLLLTLSNRCTLQIWDTNTGKHLDDILRDETKRKIADLHSEVLQISESPDGEHFAFTLDPDVTGERDRRTSVFLWSAKTRKCSEQGVVNWDPWLLKNVRPNLSPDAKQLALGLNDGSIELLRTDTLKQIARFKTPGNAFRWKDLRFSPDGKTLAAFARDETVHLLDVRTGKRLQTIGTPIPDGDDRIYEHETSERIPFRLAWSTKGDQLAHVCDKNIVRVRNLKTGTVTPVRSATDACSGLILSEDGKKVTGIYGDYTVCTWDVATGKELKRTPLPLKNFEGHLIDEDHAFFWTGEGTILVRHLGSGKLLNHIELPDMEWPDIYRYSKRHFVAQDNRHPLGVSAPFVFRLINFQTGKEDFPTDLHWNRKWRPERPSMARSSDRVYGDQLTSLAEAPNGKFKVGLVAKRRSGNFGLGGVVDEYVLRCHDGESPPRMLWEATDAEPNDYCFGVAISPDDRIVLTAFDRECEKSWIALFEATTGKLRLRIDMPVHNPFSRRLTHAFSPDGSLLAMPDVNGTTQLIDVRQGAIVAEVDGCQGPVNWLAFGFGNTLLTGGSDETVLIWDLKAILPTKPKAAPLISLEQKRLWDDLANADAQEAYKAVGRLISAEAVAVLAEQLKSAPKVDAKSMEALINTLGSPKYRERAEAEKVLLELGTPARVRVAKALLVSDNAEKTLRLTRLLNELTARQKTPDREELRHLRAIEVLEAIATKKAQGVLERLSNGAVGMRVTIESANALGRIRQGQEAR